MVKNGSSAIEDTILSVKDFINYYVILDTGSTDNTIELIQNVFKTPNKNNLIVQGKIFCEEFLGFDKSRNRLLEHAENEKHGCSHFIMLDDTYVVKNCDKLLKFLDTNKQKNDAFALSILTKNMNEQYLYYNTRVWNAHKKLRYKDPIHEYLNADNTFFIDKKVCNIFDNVNDFMKKRTMNRNEYDKKILKQMHEENPKYTRALKYLIDYHFNSYDKNSCLEYCNKLLNLIYTETSDFLNKTNQKDFYDACLKITKLLLKYYNQKSDVLKKYYDLANTIDPDRIDHKYLYACILESEQKFNEMKNILQSIYGSKIPTDSKKVANMDINVSMYTYYIPYKYIMSLIYTRNYKKAIEILNEELEKNSKNIVFKNIYDNLDFSNSLLEVNKYDAKVICFVIDNNSVNSFALNKIKTILQFIKAKGWKIFIFSNYLQEEFDTNLFEYIHIDDFYKTIKDMYIDVLVSINSCYYSVYLDNIEKTYIWNFEHNLLGDEFFTSHNTIFKGFICQSSFMKKNIHEKYSVDENKIKTFFIPSNDNNEDCDRLLPKSNKITCFYNFNINTSKERIDKIINHIYSKYNFDIDLITVDTTIEKNKNYNYIFYDYDNIDKVINSLKSSKYYISVNCLEDVKDDFITSSLYYNCILITSYDDFKHFGIFNEDDEKILMKIDLLFSTSSVQDHYMKKIQEKKDDFSMKNFAIQLSKEFISPI